MNKRWRIAARVTGFGAIEGELVTVGNVPDGHRLPQLPARDLGQAFRSASLPSIGVATMGTTASCWHRRECPWHWPQRLPDQEEGPKKEVWLRLQAILVALVRNVMRVVRRVPGLVQGGLPDVAFSSSARAQRRSHLGARQGAYAAISHLSAELRPLKN